MEEHHQKGIYQKGSPAMRILFLCNKSPWPPKEGGPMAMNMLIEGLLAEGHQVKVLAVNSFKYNVKESDIPGGYRNQTGIELIDVDLRIKPAGALLSLVAGKSYHVARFVSGKFRNRMREILRSSEFDIVQLETVFMCPYIETIRQHSQAKIVLRAHNIEHLIWQRIAEETKNPVKKWYLRHLAIALEQFELESVTQVDGIAAITPTDAGYFSNFAETGNATCNMQNVKCKMQNAKCKNTAVIDIPFGVNAGKYQHDPAGVEFPSLFSLGSMNWIPNQDGIRWFLQEVWPDVHRQFPDLKYYIAGRGMPGWMQSLKLPNVIVAGEVDHSAAFIASKAVMVVPLFSGSGIRVKIIEGMAAGKTIISTSVGAEGIRYTPHRNILIADVPCEFFEAVSICITDRALCEKIGKQAYQLATTEYNPEILVRKLIAFYQQLF